MFRLITLLTQSALILLAGCSIAVPTSLVDGGGPSNASAMVVGDEPYAVRTGAEVLGEGGSAADAAAATYFALAVTYPVAAAFGGGGICIARNPASRTEEIDFPVSNPAGGGAFAVPGNVRGFGQLHKDFGTLPWQRILVGAERLAAAGFPISRALSTRLQAAQNVVRLDASLASEFIDESGQPKPEGTIVQNAELAETMSQIRTHGADALYQGDLGDRLVSYSSSEGGKLSMSDLQSYQAIESDPFSAQLNEHAVLVPAGTHHAGVFARAIFERLQTLKAQPDGILDQDEAAAALAVSQVLSSAPRPTNDFGSTGFAVRDANGETVACAVTLGSPFGSGHTARGTGIVLSGTPSTSDAGTAAAFLSPAIAVNSDAAVLVGVGAGGPGSTGEVATAALRFTRGDADQASILNTHDTLNSDVVNAIVCQQAACLALPDPSGAGLGQSAELVR